MKQDKAIFPVVFLYFLMMSFGYFPVFAQEEKALEDIQQSGKTPVSLSFGADLMSRYIWRGSDYGNSPAIQPNLNFSVGGFSIGAWGSYGFAHHSVQLDDTTVVDAGNYAEFDIYASFTYKWFTLMVFDFFQPNPIDPNYNVNFFNFRNQTTGHGVEVSLTFIGPDKVPLQILVGTLVYGADKNQDSSGVYGLGNKNNYSTYIEASYKFNVVGIELKPFIGGIPFGSSWYGPYAGIINLGLTAKKEIPVTKDFKIPVQASLITNPQAQTVFFVFGFSL